MARGGINVIRVGRDGHAAKMLYDTGRWQRVAVPIKIANRRDYLNISNLHAYPGGTAEDRERKERLIRWTLQDADALGNRPVVICMDANCDIWKSPAAIEALTSGRWTDIGLVYGDTEGALPTYNADKDWDRQTRKGATRPDVMLMNRPAKAALVGFETVKDLPTCSHLGLRASFNFQKLEAKERTIRTPKAYPWDKCPKITKDREQQLVEEAIRKTGINFDKIMAESDTNHKWELFGTLAEEYFRLLFQEAEIEVEQEARACRSKPPTYDVHDLADKSVKGMGPEATYDDETEAEARILRVAQEAQRKLKRMGNPENETPGNALEKLRVQTLWNKLKKDIGRRIGEIETEAILGDDGEVIDESSDDEEEDSKQQRRQRRRCRGQRRI